MMEKIHASFSSMTLMQTFGASLSRVESGEVEITMPFNKNLCQQHGLRMRG
jgi:acyl-coenzyme A thioesterase PaaI-like protein